MATKLYVGGLPYSTQEDALKELFAQAGTVVSAVIIMDKMSGRSKGFGFVEMSSNDEAQKLSLCSMTKNSKDASLLSTKLARWKPAHRVLVVMIEADMVAEVDAENTNIKGQIGLN